nr:hypothetical protein [Tanacetum cinerariifolium]
MYNWIIAKYGKPSESWIESQLQSVANDVYTTFFEKAEPKKQQILRLNKKSVYGSLKKSVSQKDTSKDLLKWYQDVKDEDEEEIDEEDDEIDEEAEDEKNDSDDELRSLKSIGTTSKSLLSPKMKRTSSKSTATTKKLVVKSSKPIRNCIIGLANNKT